MEKYITKDKLADFVTKMWDAGCSVETKPKENRLDVWDKDMRLTQVKVFDKTTYDSMVSEIIGGHDSNS